MKYYKVKQIADNTRKNANKPDSILVKNELYTERELIKFAPKESTYVQLHFDIIEVAKNTTYFFFGARFCQQHPYNS